MDRVTLAGGGISVWHYDIYSGPGMVAAEPLGREKLCSVRRILFEHGSNRVWIGANHGFALGFSDNGQSWEHVHPGINDIHGYMMTDAYYGIALDLVPHHDSTGATVFDVWFGGMIRTTGDHSVFVRNDRGSHNPEERMELADFMMGVELLYRAVTTS